MGQKTVTNSALGLGVAGEFYNTANQDAGGGVLNSASEAANIAGRVVMHVADSDYEVGVAADGAIAGILSSPKTAVRQTLDAQAFIANGTQIEWAKRGYVVVALPAAADIGDWVYYSDTTGAIETKAPLAAPSAGYSRLPGGKVDLLNVTAAGLGVIYFDILAGDITVGTV